MSSWLLIRSPMFKPPFSTVRLSIGYHHIQLACGVLLHRIAADVPPPFFLKKKLVGPGPNRDSTATANTWCTYGTTWNQNHIFEHF